MPGSEARRPFVVCDASPLIFLAKLNRLDLIEAVSKREAVVLRCVREEVLSDRALPVEAERLRRWLSGVEEIDYTGSLFPSDALSACDQSTLAWAVENRAEWLLADERLLRCFARERGIQVIGFCGLLLQAVHAGRMSSREARQAMETAIHSQGLQISIKLYQQIIEQLDQERP